MMLTFKALPSVFTVVAYAIMSSALDASCRAAEQRMMSFGATFINFEEESGEEQGTQVIVPFEATVSKADWDFAFKTAFVSSERKSRLSAGSGMVNTLSDTAISLKYRAFRANVDWIGNRRATLTLNADINMPTGRAKLSGAEKNAVFNSFLVDRDKFGEGLNIGLGLGSTISLTEQTFLGSSIDYIERGKYRPDGDNPSLELDPGNRLIASLKIVHSRNDSRFNFGYRLVDEHQTKVDNRLTYDRSTSHELFGAVFIEFNQHWNAWLSGSYSRRGADQFVNSEDGQLARSDEDDSGDVYYLNLGIKRNLVHRRIQKIQ